MESFWGVLKSEKYDLDKYETFEEFAKKIEEYIHYYNYDRLQERQDGLSPLDVYCKIEVQSYET